MKGNDFLEKISLIDPAYIEAADTLPRVKKFSKLKRFTLVAACIVLIFAAGFGTYVAASEIKEYKDAVEFFEDYDLSTEGLTRGEIKKVYRDITTKSFTYSKTAEVIFNSISNDKVSGFEILQEDPTPEDIESIWDIKKHNSTISSSQSSSQNPTPPKSNITYSVRYEYGEPKSKTYLEKHNGDKIIWSITFNHVDISGYSIVSDGIIAYGGTDRQSIEQPKYPWIAKVNEDGIFLWKQQINDEFHTEYVTHVLENADGSYTVISRGDFKYFCFSKYTSDGEKILYKKTNIDIYGIKKVARFGNGYIVHLFSRAPYEDKIVMVDHEGNITESFSYSSEDSKYYITDMIEFENKIYLSAYAIPRYGNEEYQHEIDKIIEYIYNDKISDFFGEELTNIVKENYTAILLVCDPSSGKPQEFYSVKGSLGGKLALSDSGELLWDVERITRTFYSPFTSSFSIGGDCYVFRYTFDSSGLIINQEKTGEITAFRK